MAFALQDNTTTGPTAARIPAGQGSRRLGRRMHKALLVSHILTAVGWFGLAITVAFIGIVGSSNDDIAYYKVIESTLDLSIPLGLAAAATGITLSLTTRWGLVKHWWVLLKEAGAVAVIATDVLVVAPTMSDAVESGRPGEMPGPVFAHCVVLALATILSVVKPKARTPFRK